MRLHHLEDEDVVLVDQHVVVDPAFEIGVAFADKRRLDLLRIVCRQAELGELVDVAAR